MEEENFDAIQEKKLNFKKLFAKLILLIIIYSIINNIINVYNRINDYKNEQKATQEMNALIEQKNSEIELITKIDDTFLKTKTEYIEFEHGIEIPMPSNYLIKKDDVSSYEEVFETNKIAYKSHTVKIYYRNEPRIDTCLDMFKATLENYNYEREYDIPDYETQIFTRDETEGYFSYIIFKNYEVTYGVCYGEPKIRNN